MLEHRTPLSYKEYLVESTMAMLTTWRRVPQTYFRIRAGFLALLELLMLLCIPFLFFLSPLLAWAVMQWEKRDARLTEEAQLRYIEAFTDQNKRSGVRIYDAAQSQQGEHNDQ